MDDFDINKMMGELSSKLKPYDKTGESFKKLPADGIAEDILLGKLSSFENKEDEPWKEGMVSGAVYHGGEKLLKFLDKVYSIYSQSNPLHPDVWPSLTKFENEIVSMCANIMNGNESVRGAVSSGGTESILLAMKAYRDYYREKKNITKPEIILPSSAHAAFLKACDYFCMTPKIIELDENFKVNLEKVKEAITPNTVSIVGSAPSFPYGVIDPIEELSKKHL